MTAQETTHQGAAGVTAVPDRHALREHLEREAYTMALYVSVVLLAALAAVGDHEEPGGVDVVALVWGTTVGLAVAHWFAYRLAARLAAGGSRRREDFEIGLAQLAGALAVALVVTVPFVLLPDSSEWDVARLEIAGLIGVVAFLVARADGAGRLRATLYATGVVVLAAAVATIKNLLSGH